PPARPIAPTGPSPETIGTAAAQRCGAGLARRCTGSGGAAAGSGRGPAARPVAGTARSSPAPPPPGTSPPGAGWRRPHRPPHPSRPGRSWLAPLPPPGSAVQAPQRLGQVPHPPDVGVLRAPGLLELRPGDGLVLGDPQGAVQRAFVPDRSLDPVTH